MKSTGRQFLEKTNGGLDIFQKYMETQFELDKQVTINDVRFIITYNEMYGNYAIYVQELQEGKWKSIHRLNAIWYVKEKFDLTEEETYQKLENDFQFGIIQSTEKQQITAKRMPLTGL